MTRKPSDKKAARNLFIICLVTGILLILWLVMSDSPNSNGASDLITNLRETVQSDQGIPRIDSPSKAEYVARAFIASRSPNTIEPQVADVELLTYSYALARVNAMNLKGAGGVSADMLVWMVVFHDERTDVSALPVSTSGPMPAGCTYVLIDPQKGIAFQSGLLPNCR